MCLYMHSSINPVQFKDNISILNSILRVRFTPNVEGESHSHSPTTLELFAPSNHGRKVERGRFGRSPSQQLFGYLFLSLELSWLSKSNAESRGHNLGLLIRVRITTSGSSRFFNKIYVVFKTLHWHFVRRVNTRSLPDIVGGFMWATKKTLLSIIILVC